MQQAVAVGGTNSRLLDALHEHVEGRLSRSEPATFPSSRRQRHAGRVLVALRPIQVAVSSVSTFATPPDAARAQLSVRHVPPDRCRSRAGQLSFSIPHSYALNHQERAYTSASSAMIEVRCLSKALIRS